MNNKDILIACFSRSGNNYMNGSIVNLPVGNTEVAAKKPFFPYALTRVAEWQ